MESQARIRSRIRAPEFPSGTWINTREPLSLRMLRGKIVLLDFWTFCCANCLHVIDELHDLEQRYADELVIIGVHSPKFDHEKSDAAVAAAARRYNVEHPVFNDPELHLWRQYAVKAWPTLVLIDPAGYVVRTAAGEGQTSALSMLIDSLIDTHDAAGTLRRGDSPYVPPTPLDTTFTFPAKAIRRLDSLLVADAGRNRVVETALDGTTVRRTFEADLAEPNGLATLPSEMAALTGFDLVVADTVHHVLRGIDTTSGQLIRTIDLPAALASAATVTGPVPSVLSPWDLVWWPARETLAIAAAGVHLLLGWDPRTDQVEILAGTTVEGLRDGPAFDGWLAQPSGLAVDGERLWFVDSETSSLRYLTAGGTLHTAIGEGLFDFGHVDGSASIARLQHPLGLTILPDGTIAVADTYNGAVRRYDPLTDEVTTLARGLAEPSGLVVVGRDLMVVESGAHCLTRLEVDRREVVAGEARTTERPVTEVQTGRVQLDVLFEPPAGRKLDERYGPATKLTVSATPAHALRDGSGDSTELGRSLLLDGEPGTEIVLHVTAQAASCDTAAEHPACYLARQDWGLPIRLVEQGETQLNLMLLG